MPKVTFVNEYRTVEVESGRLVSDVAKELGITVCRESFARTGIGNYAIWVKGEPGSVSPVTFMEKLCGARGMKRFANRTRILGDVEVWTQGGMGNRLGSPRPISSTPTPATDSSARRKAIDAAGSAAFPYGDPRAVGKGEREAVARGAGAAAKGKAKGVKGETEASE